jgi:hypothetical protein
MQDDSDKVGQACKAAAAGTIAVLTSNFLFGFLFTMELEPAATMAPVDSKV